MVRIIGMFYSRGNVCSWTARASTAETSASTLSEWNEVLQHHPHAAWSPDGTTLATWNDVTIADGHDVGAAPYSRECPSELPFAF